MRLIYVNPNNWVENIRTGQVKMAKDLTKAETNKEEWRVLNRKERRRRQALMKKRRRSI